MNVYKARLDVPVIDWKLNCFMGPTIEEVVKLFYCVWHHHHQGGIGLGEENGSHNQVDPNAV